MQSATGTEMVAGKLKDFMLLGRKIIGAGLNYKTILQAKNLPTPEEPSIFTKPTSSYISSNQPIVIPKSCIDVIQEVELGVIIGKHGRNIKEEDAYEYVGGYCLALDMTDMGFLIKNRPKGMPWAIAKGWDTSCPVSRFISKEELPNPEDVQFYCKINSKMVQDGSTRDMLFQIPQLINYVSQYMTLEPCDLILTGTTTGSVSVKPGDHIECGLGNIVTMNIDVKGEV